MKEGSVIGFITDVLPQSPIQYSIYDFGVSQILEGISVTESIPPDITIRSGPLEHPASHMVYEGVLRRGWKYEIGDGWGDMKGTAFIDPCNGLIRVGNFGCLWCARQQAIYSSRNPDSSLYLEFIPQLPPIGF